MKCLCKTTRLIPSFESWIMVHELSSWRIPFFSFFCLFFFFSFPWESRCSVCVVHHCCCQPPNASVHNHDEMSTLCKLIWLIYSVAWSPTSSRFSHLCSAPSQSMQSSFWCWRLSMPCCMTVKLRRCLNLPIALSQPKDAGEHSNWLAAVRHSGTCLHNQRCITSFEAMGFPGCTQSTEHVVIRHVSNNNPSL